MLWTPGSRGLHPLQRGKAETRKQKIVEKETWEREIARICESDPSLRELQSQLKAAYMNQERAAQTAEKKYIAQMVRYV